MPTYVVEVTPPRTGSRPAQWKVTVIRPADDEEIAESRTSSLHNGLLLAEGAVEGDMKAITQERLGASVEGPRRG